jgi:hypothetical protein
MSYEVQHDLIDAWEAMINGDPAALLPLLALDPADLLHAGQDLIINAATPGCGSVEDIVTRLHVVGAHLQDARLVADDYYDGPGFSPTQVALLDVSEALMSSGVSGHSSVELRVTTASSSQHLANAVVSAVAVATSVSILGASPVLERTRILRAFYNERTLADATDV